MFGTSGIFQTKQYEELLDKMWMKYGSGVIAQYPQYQKQLEQLKSAGYKVMRNSEGKHKVLMK